MPDLPVLDSAGTVATCPPSLTEKAVDRPRRAQKRLLSKVLVGPPTGFAICLGARSNGRMQGSSRPGTLLDAAALCRHLLGGGFGARLARRAPCCAVGTLGVFVAVVLGIAQRIAAVAIVRRRGERPTPWWGI